MDTTPNLLLPYLMAAQAQKHVTHNEAIRALDALVQAAVQDRDLAAPPVSPADGDRYIVAATATGDWTGRTGQIAAWQDGAWMFYSPREGWVVWVADEDALVAWTGTAWIVVNAGGGGAGSVNPTPLVGVNATADTTNRLSVAAPAALLSHAGAGHQLKINKAATGDTASLLFQTGFSGRAEIGLAGDDNLHLKVSPDGTAWTDALCIDSATGKVGVNYPALPNVDISGLSAPTAAIAGSTTAGSFGVIRFNGGGGGGAVASLCATRGTGPNDYTAAQINDGMGQFLWGASDGTRYILAASIYSQVDGAISTDNVPGRILFATSPGGANNRIEALRIDSAQAVRFSGVPKPFADNTVSLGTAAARWSTVYAATGAINTSDARDKAELSAEDADIGRLAADMLASVEPILFRWKVGGVERVRDGDDVITTPDGEERSPRFKSISKPGKRVHAGFRAQDVKAVLDRNKLDSALWCLDDPSDPDSRQGLRADQMVPLLWAAVRDLSARVDQLERGRT